MRMRFLVPCLIVVVLLMAVPGSAQRYGGAGRRSVQAGAAIQTAPPHGQAGQQTTRSPDPRGQQPSAERFLQAGWDWWTDDAVKKELNLTPRQTFRITGIVNGRVKQLTPYHLEFVKQEAELNRLARERLVDDATFAFQVSRVESLRSKLNESRTVMLYQILRQLDPAQHQKLKEIQDRRRGGRGGGASQPRAR
jgi:Spy/CpxP family protein refolding chaperone